MDATQGEPAGRVRTSRLNNDSDEDLQRPSIFVHGKDPAARPVLGQDATGLARKITDNDKPLLLRADDVPLDAIADLGKSVVGVVDEKRRADRPAFYSEVQRSRLAGGDPWERRERGIRGRRRRSGLHPDPRCRRLGKGIG